jgi:hypothetical protein
MASPRHFGSLTEKRVVKAWLAHAFSVPTAKDFVPTSVEIGLVDRLCLELSRRRLTLPASVLLESFRPLGFVASQGVWISYPWFAALFDAQGLKTLGDLLERPGAIDWMLERLAADTEEPAA